MRGVRLRTWLALGAMALATAGCKKKAPRATAVTAPPIDAGERTAIGAPVALPAVVATADVGGPAASTLIAAAEDGAWTALCVATEPMLVVGASAGIPFDRLIAHTAKDVVVVRDRSLVHVDVVARTERTLGSVAAAAVDPVTRRLVIARSSEVTVIDPGVAPRTVPNPGGTPAAVVLRGARWAELWSGSARMLGDRSCTDNLSYGTRSTIDLDPAGVEAPRLGPELAITPTGEVTLDGAVVIPASCGAEVVAALADPPRVLATCGKGDNLVAGPGGFSRPVGGNNRGNAYVSATIADALSLGRRVVCIYGACVDLVTGESFSTYSNAQLWIDERVVVRAQPEGLWIDRLSDDPATPAKHLVVNLPRISAAVTVDTVTGQRRTGPTPTAPTVIGVAGGWMLYGRYVIDLERGALVATLPADALAIDRQGRVLMRKDGAPLRWRLPSQAM